MKRQAKGFYWQAVLAEVLNKDDPNHPKRFTNICDPDRIAKEQRSQERRARKDYRAEHGSKPTKKKMLYSIYHHQRTVILTYRELQVAKYFKDYCTIAYTAEDLGLSERTIEYYSKSLRHKFGAADKAELEEMLQDAVL